jgi:ApbE superfamily uncharacterized protein (UPF0280 family)
VKRHAIRIDETIATLIADEEFILPAKESVREVRQEILDYIEIDPEFESSLQPLEVSNKAPLLVQEMADAGTKAGVGPMAAVAGCIAKHVVEHLVESGAGHVVFDNGGDIAMYLQHPIIAGIYAGSSVVQGLGLQIIRTNEILGVCTSSGTVGHSLSFGCSDAALVISKDVSLADAMATALGNSITSRAPDGLSQAMRESMVPGVEGVLVIIGDAIGTCGQLPEIVRANVQYNLIAKGWEGE